jgi:hypothetical protein
MTPHKPISRLHPPRGTDRRVLRLEDFSEEEIELIANAEDGREYAPLDVELKDWKP